MYCVVIEHGEVLQHTSFIDALFDVMDCYDQIGLGFWWEDGND